jgi:hypothetical protein
MTTTLHLRNRTEECRDRRRRLLSIEDIRVIAVHRLHLRRLGIADRDLDGPTMCRLFQTNDELHRVTRGENPYAVLGRTGGLLDQCTPLLEMGAHASVWNDDAIGVAVVGDWRTETPPPATWHSVKLLVAALSVAFDARVMGHDELSGGSRDRRKECPGDLWPMDSFRSDISDTIRANRELLGSTEAARQMLVSAGAVIGG